METQTLSAPADERFHSNSILMDSSRQQVPEKRQRRETPSTSSREQQLFIPEREEDQQQEDHHLNQEIKKLFKEIPLKKQDLYKKVFKVQEINSRKQECIACYESFCISSIENTRNVQPVTTATASAQDSQAANVSLNNNSLDGTSYKIGTFARRFKERLEQIKDDNHKKTVLFIDIEILYSMIGKLIIPSVEAGETLQSLLDEHQEQHGGKEKQCAFCIALLRNGKTWKSDLFYPGRFSKKRKNSDSEIDTQDTSHSEENLIKKYGPFFHKNGAYVEHVVIFTLHSPCKEREDNEEPCMSRLQKTADQWENDCGFSTDVVYKMSWGVAKEYFNYLQYFDISPESDRHKFFKPIIEKCDNIPYKLESKYYNNLNPETFNNEDIQSGLNQLKELATSVGLRKDHLERGEKIIASLEKIQDQEIGIKFNKMRKELEAMVNNCYMKTFRKTLHDYFNTAVDYLVAIDLQLDDKGFKLYNILDRKKSECVALIK